MAPRFCHVWESKGEKECPDYTPIDPKRTLKEFAEDMAKKVKMPMPPFFTNAGILLELEELLKTVGEMVEGCE